MEGRNEKRCVRRFGWEREEGGGGGLPGSLGLGHCWYKLGREGTTEEGGGKREENREEGIEGEEMEE